MGVKYFAIREIKSDIYVYGLVNEINVIEVEAESDYSINPIDVPFVVYGLINAANQINLDFDTSIGERKTNVDGNAIFYGKANSANTIEI